MTQTIAMERQQQYRTIRRTGDDLWRNYSFQPMETPSDWHGQYLSILFQKWKEKKNSWMHADEIPKTSNNLHAKCSKRRLALCTHMQTAPILTAYHQWASGMHVHMLFGITSDETSSWIIIYRVDANHNRWSVQCLCAHVHLWCTYCSTWTIISTVFLPRLARHGFHWTYFRFVQSK